MFDLDFRFYFYIAGILFNSTFRFEFSWIYLLVVRFVLPFLSSNSPENQFLILKTFDTNPEESDRVLSDLDFLQFHLGDSNPDLSGLDSLPNDPDSRDSTEDSEELLDQTDTCMSTDFDFPTFLIFCGND